MDFTIESLMERKEPACWRNASLTFTNNIQFLADFVLQIADARFSNHRISLENEFSQVKKRSNETFMEEFQPVVLEEIELECRK